MSEFVLRVSGLARSDIGSILEISEREFGPQARVRYSGLIDAALDAVRTDPRRPGVLQRPEIGADVYTYHLIHARKPRAKGQVRRPRHLIVFRLADSRMVLVGRIPHDAMDISRHVPWVFLQDFDSE